MESQRTWSAQSYLFVPGNRPDRFSKALLSGADAVILDLEDAVEPEAKDAARERVAQWVSRRHPVLVRINGRDTQWFEEDARLGSLPGVAGIVVPKAEKLQDVVDVVARAKRRVPVYPLIETAEGMGAALEIAKAPCVSRLMFGTLDFIAEMEMGDPGEPLNSFRAQLSLVSRKAGIEKPVDGVTEDIHDFERLAADTTNGKRHGFGAKLCIHPRQVAPVHECFAPLDEELDWARRVLDAVARTAGSVTTVDGKMVDRPVMVRAQKLLAVASHRRAATEPTEVPG